MKRLFWLAAGALIVATGCESDSELAQREMESLAEVSEWHAPQQTATRQLTAIPSLPDDPFTLNTGPESLSVKGFLLRDDSEIYFVTPEGARAPLPEAFAANQEMLGKILTADGRIAALWLVWRSSGTTRVLSPNLEISPGDLGTHRPYSSDFRRLGSDMERDILHFCRLEPASDTTIVKVTSTLSTEMLYGTYDSALTEQEKLTYAQLAEDKPGRNGPRMRFSFSAPPSSLSFPVNARVTLRGEVNPVMAQFWGEPDAGDRNLMRYTCQLSGKPEDVERIEVLQSEIGVWESPSIATTVFLTPLDSQYNRS